MQRTYQLFIKYTIRKNAHARFPNLSTNLAEVYPNDFKGVHLAVIPTIVQSLSLQALIVELDV